MNRLFSVPDEDIFQGKTNDNIELLKAWAGTTLAYAILLASGDYLSLNFVINLVIAAIVCGMAFVLHELAHRIVARRFGAQAHFVANNAWLILSIVLAFAGVFIAAPGAVWHRGYLSKRQSGLIALAGPATNLVLAILFLIPFMILMVLMAAQQIARSDSLAILIKLCQIGFSLNAWIGLFNMIPAGPFDGAKVLDWSPQVFGVTVVIGLILAFGLDYLIPPLFSFLVKWF